MFLTFDSGPVFPSQVESLWELLCPLLRTALNNITVETYADWGTCIATACVSLEPSSHSAVHFFQLLSQSVVPPFPNASSLLHSQTH